jgi:hypothetical protein
MARSSGKIKADLVLPYQHQTGFDHDSERGAGAQHRKLAGYLIGALDQCAGGVGSWGGVRMNRTGGK